MNYFTSDTHYDHANLLSKPGLRAAAYRDIDDMNAQLLDACNRTAKKNDTLYVLGDFGFHKSLARIRQKILCKDLRLIWGNHDHPSIKVLFRHTYETRMIKVQGKQIWLSHYPHAMWPGSHHGSYHLYGHMHSQREADLDAIWPDRHSMDIGVDNALKILGEPRPFSENEIMDILGSRKGHDRLEFYTESNQKAGMYNESGKES